MKLDTKNGDRGRVWDRDAGAWFEQQWVRAELDDHTGRGWVEYYAKSPSGNYWLNPDGSYEVRKARGRFLFFREKEEVVS